MASKNSPFAYLADSAEETAPQREPKGLTLLQLITKLQDITEDDSSVASYRACYIEGTWYMTIDTIQISSYGDYILFYSQNTKGDDCPLPVELLLQKLLLLVQHTPSIASYEISYYDEGKWESILDIQIITEEKQLLFTPY